MLKNKKLSLNKSTLSGLLTIKGGAPGADQSCTQKDEVCCTPVSGITGCEIKC